MDNLNAHLLSVHGLDDRKKQHVVVVLSTFQDLELPHEYLSTNQTYQLLQNNLTQEIVTHVRSLLRTCKEQGVITTHEYYRLVLSVHKNPHKVRPLVFCTNGPTQNVSAFLDKLLQPQMEKVTSHFKNSADLINILASLPVPTNTRLITLNIKSLYMYTNISQEVIIFSLRKIKHHPEKYSFQTIYIIYINPLFKESLKKQMEHDIQQQIPTIQREIFGRVKFSDKSETASVSENLTFKNLLFNRLMSIYFNLLNY